MQLVPIPTGGDAVEQHAPLWMPFLSEIARHSGEKFEDLCAFVLRRQIQVILIWDEHAQRAVALIGLRCVKHGDDIVGELVWLVGRGMKRWVHLRPMLERYLKDIGCQVCRPICREGWKPTLKEAGYKLTHITMEKRL
jgi:hypothetical protein